MDTPGKNVLKNTCQASGSFSTGSFERGSLLAEHMPENRNGHRSKSHKEAGRSHQSLVQIVGPDRRGELCTKCETADNAECEEQAETGATQTVQAAQNEQADVCAGEADGDGGKQYLEIVDSVNRNASYVVPDDVDHQERRNGVENRPDSTNDPEGIAQLAETRQQGEARQSHGHTRAEDPAFKFTRLRGKQNIPSEAHTGRGESKQKPENCSLQSLH